MAGEVANVFLMDQKFVRGGSAQVRDEVYLALIQRSKAGDTDAFERLMIATQQRVASITYRLLGSREDAQDAAQEVFLRVYKNLKRFDESKAFHPWLYRIVANVCRDIAKRERRRGYQTVPLDEELENELIEQSVGPENIEEWALVRQQKALIEMAVASLPYKERTAFILRDFEGLSTEEVANVLGVRTATVRVHISSARARVRRYCERLISRTKAGSRNELRQS